MELFWHRRDLRIADNVGLAAAADGDGCIPTFVLDDEVLSHASDVRVRRLLDGLCALRQDYRALESDLILLRGDPVELLPRLATRLGADRVRWNRDYSGLARRRDKRVVRALEDAKIGTATHHDAVLHPPGTICTNAGDPYAVYSYYWRKWRDREVDDPVPAPRPADLVDRMRIPDLIGEPNRTGIDRWTDIPTPDALGFSEPEVVLQRSGTDAARERLSTFLDADVFTYDEDRDYPARRGTSRLSTHLKYGEIGPREVYATIEHTRSVAKRRPEDDAEENVDEFLSQLAWREFYTQVLFHNPHVVTSNYASYPNPIRWRDDPAEITAWKRGETGYPIVDAGMRQLRETGWMHNRVRMIVASFLTKDLLTDWRHGYAHFRQHLTDHDTMNDTGGWQWAASTGTDAQPYFRIFNPMTQGERYDPDAEYIAEYVPQLQDVDAELVHEWTELSPTRRRTVAPGYPDPIVDHAERRTAALAMFKRARGEDPDE